MVRSQTHLHLYGVEEDRVEQEKEQEEHVERERGSLKSTSAGTASQNFMRLGANACVFPLVSIFGNRVLDNDDIGNTLVIRRITRYAPLLQ